MLLKKENDSVLAIILLYSRDNNVFYILLIYLYTYL